MTRSCTADDALTQPDEAIDFAALTKIFQKEFHKNL